MSRPLVLRAVALGSALLLVGCGGDDGGDGDAAPSDSAATTTSEPSEEATTEESAPPTADEDEAEAMLEWAAGLCTSIGPAADRFGQLQTIDPDGDPAAMLQAFRGLGAAFGEARQAVEEAGPAPSADGDAAYEGMAGGFATMEASFTKLEQALVGVDPTDSEAVAAAFAPIVSDPELQAASTDITEAFGQPSVAAAFDVAPECEGLDFS